MLGAVERLRGVADEVTHHAHDVDDVLAGIGDFLRRAGQLVFLQVGERGLQLALILRDGPWEEPDQRLRLVGILERIKGREVLWICGATIRQLDGELVAELAELRDVELGGLEEFEIEVVIRAVAVLEREVGGVTPAVGFACEEADSFAGHRCLGKRGKVCRQSIERELVDEPVAFVVPGADVGEGGRGERSQSENSGECGLHRGEQIQCVLS